MYRCCEADVLLGYRNLGGSGSGLERSVRWLANIVYVRLTVSVEKYDVVAVAVV